MAAIVRPMTIVLPLLPCGMLFLVSGIAGATANASGHPAGNPDARYQRIVERNIFGLKPAPPSEPSVPPPPISPDPELDVQLTGISSFGGKKRAFFVTGAAGQPIKHRVLLEGQGDSELRLLSIDFSANTADILIRRVQRRVSLKPDGAQVTAEGTGPRSYLAQVQFDAAHARGAELHARREAIRAARERVDAEREIQRRSQLEALAQLHAEWQAEPDGHARHEQEDESETDADSISPTDIAEDPQEP